LIPTWQALPFSNIDEKQTNMTDKETKRNYDIGL